MASFLTIPSIAGFGNLGNWTIDSIEVTGICDVDNLENESNSGELLSI